MTHPDDPRDESRETRDGSWDGGEPSNGGDQAHPSAERQAWQLYPDTQPYPDSQPHPGSQPYVAHPGAQPYGAYPGGEPSGAHPGAQPYGAPPDQPTQQYGYPQQGYGQQGYGQPNPTQALPPYDPAQHYAANQQYTPTQNSGPPTGEIPYSADSPPPNNNSPRRWGIALVALAALAVVVLAGLLVVTNQRSEPSTIATRPPTTSLVPLPTLPPTQAPGVPPTAPGGLVPGGIPEILGNSGAAIGTIEAIAGTSLEIVGLDGAPVTILVTPQTQVLSLSGFDLSSLTVGSVVVVNGTPMSDGAITADIIIETPDLGG